MQKNAVHDGSTYNKTTEGNNMSNHTPGPWDVSRDEDQWPLVMGGGKIVANVNPESFYCGVADLVEMPADANARLIAAAPELYALAERIARLNKAAGEIGAGMLASLVDEANRIIGKVE